MSKIIYKATITGYFDINNEISSAFFSGQHIFPWKALRNAKKAMVLKEKENKSYFNIYEIHVYCL